jgi:hypothetical protein
MTWRGGSRAGGRGQRSRVIFMSLVRAICLARVIYRSEVGAASGTLL